MKNAFSESTRARLAFLCAILMWSSGPFFVKNSKLPGIQIAVFRALFAWIFLGGVLLFQHLRRNQSRRKAPDVPRLKPLWALVGMGICFGTMNATFVTAMTLTTAANAIFLQYTAPIWMLLLCRFWLKEPVDSRSLGSIAIAMVGVAIIVHGEYLGSAAGVTLALASGVAFGSLAVFLRYLRGHGPLWLTFVNFLFAFVMLAPFAYPAGVKEEWLSLAIYGIVQMALPYCLYAFTLKSISPQEAGVLGLLEPILSPMVAYFSVGETPSSATLWGGAWILSAVALRYLPGLDRRVEIR